MRAAGGLAVSDLEERLKEIARRYKATKEPDSKAGLLDEAIAVLAEISEALSDFQNHEALCKVLDKRQDYFNLFDADAVKNLSAEQKNKLQEILYLLPLTKARLKAMKSLYDSFANEAADDEKRAKVGFWYCDRKIQELIGQKRYRGAIDLFDEYAEACGVDQFAKIFEVPTVLHLTSHLIVCYQQLDDMQSRVYFWKWVQAVTLSPSQITMASYPSVLLRDVGPGKQPLVRFQQAKKFKLSNCGGEQVCLAVKEFVPNREGPLMLTAAIPAAYRSDAIWDSVYKARIEQLAKQVAIVELTGDEAFLTTALNQLEVYYDRLLFETLACAYAGQCTEQRLRFVGRLCEKALNSLQGRPGKVNAMARMYLKFLRVRQALYDFASLQMVALPLKMQEALFSEIKEALSDSEKDRALLYQIARATLYHPHPRLNAEPPEENSAIVHYQHEYERNVALPNEVEVDIETLDAAAFSGKYSAILMALSAKKVEEKDHNRIARAAYKVLRFWYEQSLKDELIHYGDVALLVKLLTQVMGQIDQEMVGDVADLSHDYFMWLRQELESIQPISKHSFNLLDEWFILSGLCYQRGELRQRVFFTMAVLLLEGSLGFSVSQERQMKTGLLASALLVQESTEQNMAYRQEFPSLNRLMATTFSVAVVHRLGHEGTAAERVAGLIDHELTGSAAKLGNVIWRRHIAAFLSHCRFSMSESPEKQLLMQLRTALVMMTQTQLTAIQSAYDYIVAENKDKLLSLEFMRELTCLLRILTKDGIDQGRDITPWVNIAKNTLDLTVESLRKQMEQGSLEAHEIFEPLYELIMLLSYAAVEGYPFNHESNKDAVEFVSSQIINPKMCLSVMRAFLDVRLMTLRRENKFDELVKLLGEKVSIVDLAEAWRYRAWSVVFDGLPDYFSQKGQIINAYWAQYWLNIFKGQPDAENLYEAQLTEEQITAHEKVVADDSNADFHLFEQPNFQTLINSMEDLSYRKQLLVMQSVPKYFRNIVYLQGVMKLLSDFLELYQVAVSTSFSSGEVEKPYCWEDLEALFPLIESVRQAIAGLPDAEPCKQGLLEQEKYVYATLVIVAQYESPSPAQFARMHLEKPRPPFIPVDPIRHHAICKQIVKVFSGYGADDRSRRLAENAATRIQEKSSVSSVDGVLVVKFASPGNTMTKELRAQLTEAVKAAQEDVKTFDQQWQSAYDTVKPLSLQPASGDGPEPHPHPHPEESGAKTKPGSEGEDGTDSDSGSSFSSEDGVKSDPSSGSAASAGSDSTSSASASSAQRGPAVPAVTSFAGPAVQHTDYEMENTEHQSAWRAVLQRFSFGGLLRLEACTAHGFQLVFERKDEGVNTQPLSVSGSFKRTTFVLSVRQVREEVVSRLKSILGGSAEVGVETEGAEVVVSVTPRWLVQESDFSQDDENRHDGFFGRLYKKQKLDKRADASTTKGGAGSDASEEDGKKAKRADKNKDKDRGKGKDPASRAAQLKVERNSLLAAIFPLFENFPFIQMRHFRWGEDSRTNRVWVWYHLEHDSHNKHHSHAAMLRAWITKLQDFSGVVEGSGNFSIELREGFIVLGIPVEKARKMLKDLRRDKFLKPCSGEEYDSAAQEYPYRLNDLPGEKRERTLPAAVESPPEQPKAKKVSVSQDAERWLTRLRQTTDEKNYRYIRRQLYDCLSVLSQMQQTSGLQDDRQHLAFCFCAMLLLQHLLILSQMNKGVSEEERAQDQQSSLVELAERSANLHRLGRVALHQGFVPVVSVLKIVCYLAFSREKGQKPSVDKALSKSASSALSALLVQLRRDDLQSYQLDQCFADPSHYAVKDNVSLAALLMAQYLQRSRGNSLFRQPRHERRSFEALRGVMFPPRPVDAAEDADVADGDAVFTDDDRYTEEELRRLLL